MHTPVIDISPDEQIYKYYHFLNLKWFSEKTTLVKTNRQKKYMWYLSEPTVTVYSDNEIDH